MAAITAGAPDPDVAASALAAEEASSAAFLALGNALEAISTKEKTDRERDERGAVNAAEHEKRPTERERKQAKKWTVSAEREIRTTKREHKRAEKWTAEVDEAIKCMIADGSTYTKIASELGKSLKESDINNRWNQCLKKSTNIIKPPVQKGQPSSITWTAEVDEAIKRMLADGSNKAKIVSELGNGLKRERHQ